MTRCEAFNNGLPPERGLATVPAGIVFVCLEIGVLIQAVLAYRDHFLTASQMESIHVARGLPFLWHFGMWGDFFIISPIAAYLTRQYGSQWRPRSVLISLAVGVTAASLLGWLYTFSAMPEAHVQTHHLTGAGVIHQCYMAAVVSVLVEFFIFTPSVSLRVLRVVSVLVMFHLVLGTHIALGVLNAFEPLHWYSGEPLKSIFAYATITTVAFALLWRNLNRDWVLRKARVATPCVDEMMMRWTKPGPYRPRGGIETPHGLLRFLDSLGGHVLEFGCFWGAAWAMWLRDACRNKGLMDIEGWIRCVGKVFLPCVLVLLFGIVFWLSRRSGEAELDIAERIFPPGRLPRGWGGAKDPVGITLSVICYFALYIALASLAYDIRLASLLMLTVACIDFNTRRLINKKVAGWFSDKIYNPKVGDEECELIERRRTVVRQFLFGFFWNYPGIFHWMV